jgi:hypothetical protein
MTRNQSLTDTQRKEVVALVRSAVTLLEEDFPALALTHGQSIDILAAIEKLNTALEKLTRSTGAEHDQRDQRLVG